MKGGVRDVLMVGYFFVWAVVVVLTALRTGEIAAELWAVLGVGEGALMALFRGDEAWRRRNGEEDDR